LDLGDPALRKPGAPGAAWRLFRSLTPRYAAWAQHRVTTGVAENLSTSDIAGTEWPLFGSVFYLWAVENLQAAWEAGDQRTGVEPRVFAKEAIVAASELVIDPKHATWVKQHWGEDYLHRENVFYRMLLIASLTSRHHLVQDGAHLELLRDQVDSLARELDASKSGLLEDYPGECYPGDVMAALMCIKRADAVLGSDHSTFINRSLRAFIGNRATRQGLPPYVADAATGMPRSEARGCADSYMCLSAPELWPAQAKLWFELYDRFFWQERFSAAGYREFVKGTPRSDWTINVDAGPVIAGHGVAASAFGLGAARKNGRFDRAYPLAAEMLATTVELPNGVLVVPRLLSNFSDAPMLGEAAILWQLSIQPQPAFPLKTGGRIPVYVYIVLLSLFLFGAWRILESLTAIREARREAENKILAPRFQVTMWTCLLLGSLVAFATHHGVLALIVLVLATFLPVAKRKPRGVEDWPDPPAPGSEP
jgi:hypothetical protein